MTPPNEPDEPDALHAEGSKLERLLLDLTPERIEGVKTAGGMVCPECQCWVALATLSALAAAQCPGCGGALLRSSAPTTRLFGLGGPAAPQGSLTQKIEAAAANEGLVAIGEYLIEEEIGAGGMGVVFRARHAVLNKQVALKVIQTQGLGSACRGDEIERFLTEARTAVRVNHPNIITVHHVGDDSGRPYLVMDLIEGPTLHQLIEAGLPKPARALEIIEKCADASGAFHRAGVLHRDLKPGNILMAGGSEPMVGDFGLAREVSASEQLTRTGEILGTPTYMSPEQARGDRSQMGPPTDVWSLGVILFEMLTGQPPVSGDNPLHVLDQILHRDPPLPRQINPLLPAEIEAICIKCMERNPQQRYADGLALAEDCRRYREGYAVQARSAGSLYRLRKWLWRNRLRLTFALLFTVGIAAALYWPTFKARRRQDRRARLSALFLEQVDSLRESLDQRIEASPDAAALAQLEAELSEGALRRRLRARLEQRLGADSASRFSRALLAQALLRIRRVELRVRAARRMGELHRQGGRAQASVRAYARAYRLSPKSADGLDALMRVAEQHLARGRHQVALSGFKTVYASTDRAPHKHRALEGGAEALFSLGQVEHAVATLERARQSRPLTARGRMLDALCHSLRRRTELPFSAGAIAAGNLDGIAGDELLVLKGQQLQVWTWRAKRFVRLLSRELGAVARAPAIGDLTGDGKPEVVLLLRRKDARGRAIDQLLILGALNQGLPTRYVRSYPAGMFFLRATIADADGDGVGEVYLGGAAYRRQTRVIRHLGGWRDEVFDARVRSDVHALTVAQAPGQRRLLLMAAGPWQDFSLRAYEVQRDRAPRLRWRQLLGEVRSLAAADLDGDGLSEICANVTHNVTHDIPLLFGDDLSRRLPGGLYLFRWKGPRLVPVLHRTQRTLQDWVSPRVLRSGRFNWFIASWVDVPLIDRPATLVANPTQRGTQFISWRKGQPVLFTMRQLVPTNVVDLDGDGRSELLVGDRQRATTTLRGLGRLPAQSGEVLGGLRKFAGLAGSGGKALSLARDLVDLGLFEQATLELQRIRGGPDNRAAGLASLGLVDVSLARGQFDLALRQAAEAIARHPEVRRAALWKRIEVHRARGDYRRLRRDLEALTGGRPLSVEDLYRAQPLRQVLAEQDRLALHVSFPRDAQKFVATDPLLARPAGRRMQLFTPTAVAHFFGVPLSFDGGAWRLRARFRVLRMDWTNRFTFGIFPARGAGQIAAIQFHKWGGDWNMVEAFFGTGTAMTGHRQAHLPAGSAVAAGEIDLEVLYEPNERVLWGWLRKHSSGQLLGRQRVALGHVIQTGPCRAGLMIGGGREPGLGQILLSSLTIETTRPQPQPPFVVSLDPAAVAASQLLQAPDKLRQIFARRLGAEPAASPGWLALRRRSYALSSDQAAGLVAALGQAASATDGQQRLVEYFQRAMRERKFWEALLALNTLRARGARGPQLARARLQCLIELRWWRPLLNELDSREQMRGIPRWYGLWCRGRALLGLERFTQAQQAFQGAERLRRGKPEASRISRFRRKARWKQLKLVGKAPVPEVRRYLPEKCWKRAR